MSTFTVLTKYIIIMNRLLPWPVAVLGFTFGGGAVGWT